MERAAGIEPASSAWKAEVIAIIRCTLIVLLRKTKQVEELERAAGIEPASSAWKAEVIAIIRCTHIVLTRSIMPHLTENETFFS